jgi:hypothetical protein
MSFSATLKPVTFLKKYLGPKGLMSPTSDGTPLQDAEKPIVLYQGTTLVGP